MQLSFRPVLLLLFCLSAVIGVASPSARGGVIISSETVFAAPGSSGFVQISLTNDFSTSQTLSAFSIDLSLSGADVVFTGVDALTSSSYVFNGIGLGTLSFDPFPTTSFIASDVVILPPGFATLAAGQTYGLARIGFDVSGGASAGLRPITFTIGSATEFLDEFGAPYASSDLSFTNGGVNVQGFTTTVPEPASAAIFLINIGCALFASRMVSRRRRGECQSSEFK
jgi:hypothetical protein